jgi:hypothetical protein
MNAAEVKRETESLAKRYPKKGIDLTIPPEIREDLMERRRQREMAMGEKASRYAKGGVTRADGCAKKGHTKGRMV